MDPPGGLRINKKGAHLKMHNPEPDGTGLWNFSPPGPVIEIVRLLLHHGARVNETELAAAKTLSDTRVLNLLEQHAVEQAQNQILSVRVSHPLALTPHVPPVPLDPPPVLSPAPGPHSTENLLALLATAQRTIDHYTSQIATLTAQNLQLERTVAQLNGTVARLEEQIRDGNSVGGGPEGRARR
ncbi:hypothetical protein HDU93_005964 [Gonapodya sp. JEL0774]|nr:hypothetical protein HDU93_005964 [Gonapodya sp. JEL0774]